MPETPDIKGLDKEGLARLMEDMGQPLWRAGQMVRWLYGRGVTSFAEMTDLSAALREELAESYRIEVPEVAERLVSRLDGTRKYLFRLADGVSVESVGMPGRDRLTVCFSTQAGCAMGCSFCATGAGGFVRNLSPGEMVDQVRVVGEDFGERVSNAVAMGQGEPFANYDALLGALRLMNSEEGLGIGARHVTVSTCGILPGIQRFAAEPEQFTLAVSLHSAVQSTRDRLMPGVRGFPLQSLRTALADYFATSGRRPTLEYALIGGENDSDEELGRLLEFCEGMPFHVNLIPVNPVAGSGMTQPAPERVARFREALARAGVEASVRIERGADLQAACGQLRQRFEPPFS